MVIAVPFLTSLTKVLSTCVFESEGNGIFLKGSSVRTQPVGAHEIKQGTPFANLSRFDPRLHVLKIGDLTLLAEVILQVDGGYVSKASASRFDAIGQGDTEEEAIEDIKCAIRLLKEATSKMGK